jgi:hypothetical protein
MAPMTQAVIALGHSSKLHNSPDSCHMIFVNVTDVRGDIVIEPDYTCRSINLRRLCSISRSD